jgi:hypothetical protein
MSQVREVPEVPENGLAMNAAAEPEVPIAVP